MIVDLRTLALHDWLEHDLLLDFSSVAPASSDASFRRYFRVTTADASLIVMDAPPDKENLPAFLQVAELFAAAGVKVPAIYHQNLDEGFLLLEDFGQQPFLASVSEGDADGYYRAALATLLNLQTRLPAATCPLPRYDAALLTRELGVFTEWFAEALLDLPVPEAVWADARQALVASALAQPLVCVHRDYHSRNLMVLTDGDLGVLDFQDAVVGPITYDLVSLLRDCYIAWPAAQVELWLAHHHGQLQQAGLLTVELAQFRRWFDWMGLQRHLKAIGIFARLHLRDGKSHYLHDISRTLDYVLAVTGAYPELAALDEYLRGQHSPAWQAFLTTLGTCQS